jgi:thiamine pyrophosphate-dependent acetolactate synthase large subunit-like protein
MLEEGIEPVGVDLDAPDLPKLAEALGGSGVRAATPAELEHALKTALDHPGPTLIELPDRGSAPP